MVREGTFPITKTSEMEKVDRKAPEILAALKEAPVFKKQGIVNARPAIAGEKIDTVLAGGAKETTNTANEGDWIVKNPSGEEYIIPGKKFEARYEKGSDEGVYTAKGHCKAVVNPFGKPISIIASWGEEQIGDENCMIADVCDVEGNQEGEPYIIEAKAFADTYKQV